MTQSYHVFRKVTSSERNRDVLTLDRKIERAGGREVVSRSRSTRHKRNYKSDLQQNQHRPSKIVESRTNNTYFDSFVQGRSSPIGNQRLGPDCISFFLDYIAKKKTQPVFSTWSRSVLIIDLLSMVVSVELSARQIVTRPRWSWPRILLFFSVCHNHYRSAASLSSKTILSTQFSPISPFVKNGGSR